MTGHSEELVFAFDPWKWLWKVACNPCTLLGYLTFLIVVNQMTAYAIK